MDSGKKKIYISGPITGVKDYEKRFEAAQKALSLTFPDAEIVNPVNLARRMEENLGAEKGSLPREAYMREDILHLLDCDSAVFMDGWSNSLGCLTERSVCEECGIGISEIDML